MAILGLDFGKKRVGVALSESGVQANPLQIIHYNSPDNLLLTIAQICQENDIDSVVVGEPENDQIGARRFGEKLKHQLNLPVHFIIEDMSSLEAQAIRKNSAPSDDLAAALILQDYLDSLSSSLT